MQHDARFASFDGVTLAYSVRGAGPDVLLMHGFASSAFGNWIRPGIAEALVAAGRRVIAYDARGHGESDKPHEVEAYENEALVRDARGLIEHLGIGAVDVVGYSMGAIVGARVVAAEPCSRSFIAGGIGGGLARARDPQRRERIADALEARDSSGLGKGQARAFRRFAERSANDLRALAALQRASALRGVRGTLSAIHVPTLVVAGVDDQLAGSPHELAARISGAVADVVPGNHLTAVMQPKLREAIVGFLARVSPVSA